MTGIEGRQLHMIEMQDSTSLTPRQLILNSISWPSQLVLQADLHDIRCPSHVCAADLSKAVYQPNDTSDDRAVVK